MAKGTITPSANPFSQPISCDPTANGFQFTENYVLGPSGEELTQIGVSSGGSPNWQRTNVYAAGKLLATYDMVNLQPALHFHLTDPLGTRRMQLSGMLTNLGQPETDIQSLPYGDQLASYPDQYAPANADDSTPLYFTGKERDNESGLDYFGARYYASTMGRFSSPDWSARIEPVPYSKLDDPQSLNLYSYVLNNPLSRTDPDGHEVDLGNSDKKLRDQAQTRILSNVNKNERGLFTTSTDKNGTTKLVLNKDAAANFDGKHSAAYGMLNQAINAKAVATVTVGDVQTVGTATYHVQDSGGGKTVPTGNGNVSILLSEHPDPLISQGILPLRGMNGEVVPNPPGIIAGHELLGHGRLEMLGRPYGEGEAIGVENQLRREQGLPLRNPQDY